MGDLIFHFGLKRLLADALFQKGPKIVLKGYIKEAQPSKIEDIDC